jgi:hypothetical protein
MDDKKTGPSPIACFLDGKSYRERLTRIRALVGRALLSRDRLATSVRLRFRLDTGVEEELKTLVALERECCPFLVLELEKSRHEAVLVISGPDEAAYLLDDAFGGAGPISSVARDKGTLAVVLSAIVAALGVTTCCVLPLGLALFGIGTAASVKAVGSWIEPHKKLVSIAAGLALAYGFFIVYRPRRRACDTASCATQNSCGRMTKVALWVALILLVVGVIVR